MQHRYLHAVDRQEGRGEAARADAYPLAGMAIGYGVWLVARPAPPARPGFIAVYSLAAVTPYSRFLNLRDAPSPFRRRIVKHPWARPPD